MDVKAATIVEDDMSQSWLELIDEEEDALLNEAVSHTIRQLSAEIRSNSPNVCVSPKIGNKVFDRCEESLKTGEEHSRISEEPRNGGTDSVIKNTETFSHVQGEDRTEKDTIEIEEDSSPPLRKRPREDSVNSLPAKISRNRHNSSSSSSTNSSSTSKKKIEYETDPATLARRQKDIDYGKNTIGYDRYIQAIPKKDRAKEHPKTPPKYVKYSRRGWDGMVRLWRKQLHAWDPTEESNSSIVEDKDRRAE